MTEFRREIHFGNRLLRTYADRPGSVLDLLHNVTVTHPDAIAVTDDRVRLSYEDMWAHIVRFSGSAPLAGLPRGSRLLLSVGNSVEFAVAFFGCIFAGLIPIPVGARLRRAELVYIAGDADAKAAIFDEAVAEHIPDEADLERPFARIIIPADFSVDGAAPLSPEKPAAPPPIPEDDTACILYTSGTTGRPKGAMLAHLNLVHSAIHWREVLELGEGESTALVVPASHVTGIAGILVPFLAVAGTIHFVREFKAPLFLQFMARERVTHALLVPAMYNLCLRTDEIGSLDLSPWRLGLFGGAPMPVPTIERYRELLPGLAMRNAYGATETTSPSTIMPLNEPDPPHDSVGRMVPCGSVIVVDEDGREVAPGEAGELLIGGPMVVPGYWNNPEANASSFVDGHWRSGDIGSVDRHGFVRVFDRKKDMINRGGYKLFPAEVESVLQGFDGVIEVAIIGYPCEVLGERSHAIIVSDNDALSGEAIQEFCRTNFADYKVPDRVTVTSDPLPRNANGKVQKTVLRERYVQ